MEGSIIVARAASENSSKETVVNLDAVQCNVEQVRGRDSLSVTPVKKIRIRENSKQPVIDSVGSNKIGKGNRYWERFIVEVDKTGRKHKASLGKVESEYYSKTLDKKLEKAREKAGVNGREASARGKGMEKA